jgi:hypothetical protein
LNDLGHCKGIENSPIHIFCDGPKTVEQRNEVEAVRAVAQELLGKRASYHFAEHNKGLARSIIDGVNLVVNSYGRVIVIEDDLALSPDFLAFMNAALIRYADNPEVLQVAGHMFDVPEFCGRQRAVLLPFVTTWGWATWARAWSLFDETARGWECLLANRALRRRFNLDGAYDYTTMIIRQMRGTCNSWGICWYWSFFRADGLAVYPPQTLVRNCGFDGSGSHGRGLFRRYADGRREFLNTTVDLPMPTFSPADYNVVKNAIKRQNGGLIGRVIDVAKAISCR